MILLDSNVLIDLMQGDGEWQAWSSAAVEEGAMTDQLAVSSVVVAEVAPRSGTLADFIERIGRFGAVVVDLDNEAAYAAGSAFQAYRARRRGDPDLPRSIIADFLIGGQALILGAAIMTRDARFYRRYFPFVSLITPDEATA